MIGESSNRKILGGLLTLGTLVGITIAGGFIIRGYLDILRIKAIKKELKTYSDE